MSELSSQAIEPSSTASLAPDGLQSGVGFTPGPWFADRHPESDRADCVKTPAGRKVAYCQPLFGRPHVTFEQTEANARLIAAAPDLLAACLNMVPSNVCLTNGRWPDSTVVPLEVTLGELRAVRAAISKALGKEA